MINLKTVLEIWLSRLILIRSVNTAFVVGTILAFINHGYLIISAVLTPECWKKMVLTTLVPYSVASWAETKAKIDTLASTWLFKLVQF